MRSFIMSTLLVALVCAGTGPASVASEATEPVTLVLRVTGVDAERPVRFEGTVVAFNADEPYRPIAGRTPYELKVTTTALHGVLRSKSAKESVKVQVFKVEGEALRQLSMVTGSVVVVEQDYELGQSRVKGASAPKKL